jgi:hypothetical protein
LTEREGEESGEKMVLTCGAHMSASEEGIGWGTDSVFFLGCGLLPLTGPKGSPGPILFLFLLFHFSFSVFCIDSNLVQNSFKTNRTKI